MKAGKWKSERAWRAQVKKWNKFSYLICKCVIVSAIRKETKAAIDRVKLKEALLTHRTSYFLYGEFVPLIEQMRWGKWNVFTYFIWYHRVFVLLVLKIVQIFLESRFGGSGWSCTNITHNTATRLTSLSLSISLVNMSVFVSLM